MSAIFRFCLTQSSFRLFQRQVVNVRALQTAQRSVTLAQRSALYVRPGTFLRPFFLRSAKYSSDAATDSNANTTKTNAASLSKWRKLWRPFIWLQVTLGLGLLAIVVKHYKRHRTHPEHSPELIAKDWELHYYRVIPFRALSRAWGWITSRELPVWARQPVIGFYSKAFGCNLSEALEEQIENYPSLSEFFRRKLKEGARIVDMSNCVVAPSDGTVLHFGPVTEGMVEQVKGVNYSISEFLGPAYWKGGPEVRHSQVTESFEKSLLTRSDTSLYHCVIYLAPGDYHCFHSPVEWTVNFRRHFPGELFSVHPLFAKWVAGLFSLNERAVYVGQWRYGFFSMSPVGATNVGSIRVYQDPELRTNCSKRHLPLPYYDRHFDGVTLKKGEIFGEFNLGSTIVLIFEAPKNFKFGIEPGQKILMGQRLNLCLDN